MDAARKKAPRTGKAPLTAGQIAALAKIREAVAAGKRGGCGGVGCVPATKPVRISTDRASLVPWSLVIDLRGVPCATLHPHDVPTPDDDERTPGAFERLWRWAFGGRQPGYWSVEERKVRAMARAIFPADVHPLLDVMTEGELTTRIVEFIACQQVWNAMIGERAGATFSAARGKATTPGTDAPAEPDTGDAAEAQEEDEDPVIRQQLLALAGRAMGVHPSKVHMAPLEPLRSGVLPASLGGHVWGERYAKAQEGDERAS